MNKKEELLDHDYDGIQELDNPLPGWWLATFYGAIVFSVLYVGYYHIGSGPSPEQELAADMARVHSLQNAGKQASGPDEALLAAVLQDPLKVQEGQKVYGEKCASCHGPKGEGLIGPNLTDRFWLHGRGGMLEIFASVADGIPAKGMPPWKGMLKAQELQNVVAYVKKLEGSNAPNGKAPQGVEVK